MSANPTSALDVAAAIVKRHQPIDQLKLQKILFYAAGEYAALTGEAMFPEPLEAWDWGPVVYDLWKECHRCEDEFAITEPLGDPSNLNSLAIACVESALDAYGERSGANLIDLTHKEPAWKDAYEPGQRRTPIPLNSLVKSFRAKYENVVIPSEVLDKLFAKSAGA
jgi:uncharacterized phage-associated protein